MVKSFSQFLGSVNEEEGELELSIDNIMKELQDFKNVIDAVQSAAALPDDQKKKMALSLSKEFKDSFAKLKTALNTVKTDLPKLSNSIKDLQNTGKSKSGQKPEQTEKPEQGGY